MCLWPYCVHTENNVTCSLSFPLQIRRFFFCNQDVRRKTVEKYKRCLEVGYSTDWHLQTTWILLIRMSALEYQRTVCKLATGLTLGYIHVSGVSYGRCKPCKKTCKTLEVMGESTYNTSKENARAQVSRTLPLRDGCVCSHPMCTQRIMCMLISLQGLCDLNKEV